VLDPWESASVAWWMERAAVCCREIESRGRRVLFVGGTPLYLKALLHGLFDGPPGDPELRRQLREEAERLGPLVLHGRLTAVDPATAQRLHPNDVRRVIRALEVWQLTGRPLSAWQTQWNTQQPREPVPASGSQEVDSPVARCLWLDLPRAELYARIDRRVQQMVASGLVEEVSALRRLSRPLSREAIQAVGYLELFEYLEGQASLDETIRRIQVRTRQFAKRQITWFRHMPECRPVRWELTFPTWSLKI
jgi:tRNA dimethylallyltransferase